MLFDEGLEPVLLLTVIVNHGQGSRVLRVARRAGISGGTILLGQGTFGRDAASWSEECGVRKELVLLLGRAGVLTEAMAQIGSALRLDKPSHGIAFMMDICTWIGSSAYGTCGNRSAERKGMGMKQAVFVVVDRGVAETVVEAAERAGANGATIVHARGAGVHETARLFAMEVEPEKEIVLLVVESDRSGAITEAIREAARLDEPGNGILFSVDVRESYGIAARED
ncbi:MAG: P-II family nitrogen regulator [Clostridia bacterium]|nr:P-II family nitrogen regulator [Clostridia bacterium]